MLPGFLPGTGFALDAQSDLGQIRKRSSGGSPPPEAKRAHLQGVVWGVAGPAVVSAPVHPVPVRAAGTEDDAAVPRSPLASLTNETAEPELPYAAAPAPAPAPMDMSAHVRPVPASEPVDVLRVRVQPPEIVASDTIIPPLVVSVAVPPDAPQLFVHAFANACGLGGESYVAGLPLVELRNGIAEFRKLRIVLGEGVRAAQLQLVFSVHAVVEGQLRQVSRDICAATQPFFVTSVEPPCTIHTCAASGDAEALMECVLAGDINEPDDHGRTAVHLAAAAGHSAIVRLLLAAGAAVDVRDRDGDTALHAAALGGVGAACVHLLDAGADPNSLNFMGCSPLHYAACAHSADTFEVLVLRGAHINRPLGGRTDGARPHELFPDGLLRVQSLIQNKEREVRQAIRAGLLASPQRNPAAAAAAAAGQALMAAAAMAARRVPTAANTAAAVADRPMAAPGGPSRSAAARPARRRPSPGALSAGSDSDAGSGGWDDAAGAETWDGVCAGGAAGSLAAQAAEAAATAPVLLRVLGGLEPPVFKDSPLRLRLALQPNVAAGGSARDVQRVLARLDGRLRAVLHVEDGHGDVIAEVAKGRRTGARIVNQHEFDVQVAADGTAELANVRVREVSRNHPGGAFRFVVVPLSCADMVAPAVTRLFHVLSERIRAPSYRNQISRQRERRMKRAVGTVAGMGSEMGGAPPGELSGVDDGEDMS